MSDNKRLISAITLSMVVLLLWQIFFLDPPVAPDAPQEETQQSTEKTPANEAPKGDVSSSTKDETSLPVPPKKEIAPQSATLETSHYTLELSNVGARGFLQKIKEPVNFQARGDLFSALHSDEELDSSLLPFEVTFESLDRNSVFEILPRDPTAGENKSPVHFLWTSDGGQLQVEKTYSPGGTDFEVHLNIKIKNLGKEKIKDDLVLLIHGKQSLDHEPSFFEPVPPMEAVCFTDDGTERADKDDDEESFSTNVRWAGISDAYFLHAALSKSPDSCQIGGHGEHVTAGITQSISIAAGEVEELDFRLYIGPKQQNLLNKFGADVELERAIDYGWFEFLSKPLHWALVYFYGFLGNWGWTVFILTLLIRALVWPITQKSQDSMVAMQELSPLIKELKEKYPDDPQLVQKKQMALFKEHNVSPFGCLPLFLQIPIWISFYRMIYASAELYQAPFLWIDDLSAADPYYILPTVVTFLFFLQQYFSPSRKSQTQVNQKLFMLIFLGMFSLFTFVCPAGLNVYFFVSTSVGIFQMFYAQKRKANRAPLASAAGAGIEVGSDGVIDIAADSDDSDSNK